MAALMIAGAVMGAMNSLAEGEVQKRTADMQARNLRTQAGQEQAVAQRAQGDQLRQGRLVSSRAQALLAASGGDASGPGAEKILGDLAAENEYRAGAALYQGDARAARLRDEANQAEYAGKAAKQASYNNALAEVVGGVGKTMYDRYRTPPPAGSSGGWGAGLGGNNLYTSRFGI